MYFFVNKAFSFSKYNILRDWLLVFSPESLDLQIKNQIFSLAYS